MSLLAAARSGYGHPADYGYWRIPEDMVTLHREGRYCYATMRRQHEATVKIPLAFADHIETLLEGEAPIQAVNRQGLAMHDKL
jgi:hypothetical protein